MGKKHVAEHNEQVAETQEEQSPVEGADTSAEQSATSVEPSAEPEVQQTAPVMSEVVMPKITFGIGQFARWLILNTDKNNAEILALVRKVFPGAETTPACIAWYKTDLRKKGLLAASEKRSGAKVINLTAEQLAALIK